jgi:membrane protein
VGGPNSIRRTYWAALKSFNDHQLTDVAAALTYYAAMSLFPGLLLALTLLGVLGNQALVENAADYVTRHGADPTTARVVKSVLQSMLSSSAKGLGIALVIAIALGLNSVSGAFGAAGRALNRVFDVKDDRGFIHKRLVNLAIAAIVMTLLIVVLASMFLGGQIADDLFENTIGLGSTAAAIWAIARFPLALLVALLVYALVYAYAPDVSPRKLRIFTPGAMTGVAAWILASTGFFIYVKNFSTYGTAYGIAGAMIILLLWLWLGACAFLLGAEINCEFARRKERRTTSTAPAVKPEAEAAAP